MRCPAACEEPAARAVRIPELRAGLRHFPVRLQADVRREGLDAAARAAADRRLHARSWPVRFVDENIARATDEDFAWADALLVSGMHIQVEQIRDIQRRASAAWQGHGAGRSVGVSVARNATSDYDYLHVGEMGDATDAIVAHIATIASSGPRARWC